MVADHTTKHVFSELDGFLVLVSILVDLQATCPRPDNEDGPPLDAAGKMGVARVCYTVLCETLISHPANRALFEVSKCP